MNTKICTKCGNELEINEDNFSKYKDGYLARCKICIKDEHKKYYEKNKEKCKAIQKKYYESHKDEFLSRVKKHRENNPGARKQEHINYRKKHLDKITKYQSEYRKNNKVLRSQTCKRYYYENKDRIAEYAKKHRQTERGKQVNIMTQNRRIARKRKLDSTLTPEQWQRCKKHFDNKCAYCGLEKPLEQEHFIPVARGGEYTHNNIVPCCRNCNPSKGDKDFFIWYPQQSYYSKVREKKILKYLNYKGNIQQLSLCL